LVRTVHEHGACNLIRELVGIHARDQSAQRMAHEYIRRFNLGVLKQQVKLMGFLFHGPWSWTQVAPGETGTVIGADLCEPRYAWLYRAPVERIVATSSYQHDRRLARAGGVQVELVAAKIH